MDNPNDRAQNGEAVRCSAVVRLWYVHLTPKKKRDEQQMKSDLAMLARGPGATDMEKLMWVAKAMCGIADSSEEKWATRRQKPLAFISRSDAVIEAEKHENEYWHASVREMRVIEPNSPDQRQLCRERQYNDSYEPA